MELDLNSLDLKDLKALQAKVAKAVATFEERRKKQALAKLDETAREMGFASLAELTGTAAPRKRTVSGAKYANPANAADTWSGRGRKPRWYVEALASGKTESDLLI